MELKSCPFCGSKAEVTSRYDSDDHRPDGLQVFVECSSCGARSAEYYAVDINEANLTPEQRKNQHLAYESAKWDAIETWNKRVGERK